ncbi:hypothetical protein [Brevibacillus migulae]|uniref:hypothetical protein n=1 Tax=Brevibacillus migulae TaxID=1644114 RepID=UPI00106E2068|nr:hypothetical protein [Brevibacillus migulae]
MFSLFGPQKKQIRYKYDFNSLFAGYQIVSVSLGSNQEICCLGVDHSPELTDGMFPPSATEKHHQYKITILTEYQTQTLMLPNQRWNYHFVQPAGNDEFLVVSARSHKYKDDSYDCNGKVFSINGELKREFLLGDGIQDLAVNSDGTIWTSYFDEGVFGNYGWDKPVGSAGLLAWNMAGEKRFAYDGEAGTIEDCYALNAANDHDTWFYFYSDFHLVRLTDFRVTANYECPIQGSDGFAVYDQWFLFRGGYGKRDVYTLFSLSDKGRLVKKKELVFVDQAGSPITASQVYCRGRYMLLLDKYILYLIDLKELV